LNLRGCLEDAHEFVAQCAIIFDDHYGFQHAPS
jgi:hypothetical protein